MNPERANWKTLTLRHAGVCSECYKNLEIGTLALWNPSGHFIKCLQHKESTSQVVSESSETQDLTSFAKSNESINFGTAGGSAKAEANRRIKNREKRITTNFPRIGKFLLAVTDDPQSTKAWEVGAVGEIAVGKALDKYAAKYSFTVIHDRRLPNSKANIDHLAITTSGIFVIDAKNYEGVIKIKDESGFFSEPNLKLFVGGRNCMNLVSGMKRQVEVINKILEVNPVNMPVIGVLAFYKADWDQFKFARGQVKIQEVLINSQGLEPIISMKGPFTTEDIKKVTQQLLSKLSSAI